ncbi:MAG: GatB/YqeY domain-containing protein [Bacteroidales bacterium]|nr:GatB/YqeY domain-containing protein [Bacteroidales bacterium]MCF8337971.1 GatB/YqeY domain-containing protein [Bacteroidales bacterium]
MSLEKQINEDLKQAMRDKDQRKLSALRAIKSALLIEKTNKDQTSGEEIPESVEMQLLQKQVKQRKESAEQYEEQGRTDLAEEERFQASIIEKYLPDQMDEQQLENEIKAIIDEVGATSMQDMGKVMGAATKRLAGKAENKKISEIVKSLLA